MHHKEKRRMNNRIVKLGLLSGALIISAVSFAQKKNETSAAVEYKNQFPGFMQSGDVAGAKASLLKAKEYIDLAASHPDTKDSPKTLYLKGEIYSSILAVGMQAQDVEFIQSIGDNGFEDAISSYKRAYDESNKFDVEIEEAINTKRLQMDGMAGMLYNNKNYAEAAEMYETTVKMVDAISQVDTNSLFNAALSYERIENYEKASGIYEKVAKTGFRGAESYALAASAYRKAGNVAKSEELLNEGKSKFPASKEILLEMVQTKIDAGDNAGAEKALNEAISKDPNNKLLYYVIGTIYMDLDQNDKAETSLNKALEIDPAYADAQYQLGAHLVTWAGELRTEASQLKFGDPNYDKMISQSDEIYKRALTPLEKYIEKYPEEKTVLTILYQIHRSLGNSEKALEYKKLSEQ